MRSDSSSSPGSCDPEIGAAGGRRDLWIAAAAALGATLFHLIYFDHGVRNWIDLGVAATDAARILDGQVFGRDFIAPYGPGRYYLTALWFWLFGESLRTLSLFYVALMAIVPFAVYLLARRFMPRTPALAAVLLSAVAHGPMHKVYLGLFSALAVWAACRALDKRTFAAGFVMGLAGAVAGLFRYDLGAIALVCGVLVVLAAAVSGREARPASSRTATGLGFIAGGSTVMLPVAAALAAWGDPAWVVGHVLHRVKSVDLIVTDEPSTVARLASGEADAIAEGVLSLFYLAAPIAVLLIGAGWLLRRKTRPAAASVLVLGLFGVFLLNQWRLIPQFSRLTQVGPLIYIGMMFLAYRLDVLAARGSGVFPWAVRAGAGLFVAGVIAFICTSTGHRSQDSIGVLRFEERYLDLDKGRIWAKRMRSEYMDTLVSLVRRYSEEQEPIFAGPGCPIAYFLADRPNPTPYTDPFLYFYNPEAEARVINALEASGVQLFVDQPRSFGGPSLPSAAPRLFAYLDGRFPVAEQVGTFVIRRRR